MRLAVLITYFNEKEWLTKCLASLQANTEPPDEILVYDDASSHPPEPYIPSGLPVRVVKGVVNCGPAKGRNHLLASTSCDYVHFHDADDTFRPTWGGEIRKSIQSSHPDAVFTELAAYEEGHLRSEAVIGLDLLERDNDLVRFCIHHAILPASGTYRREKLLEIGGYATDLWQSEDYDFHLRLAALKPNYRVIPQPLVNINIRTESRSQNQIEVFGDQVKILKRLVDVLPSEYRQDIAETLAIAGGKLYRLGAQDLARDAFQLSTNIAALQFPGQRPMYRFVAQRFGQESAEMVGKYFRLALPEKLRRIGHG